MLVAYVSHDEVLVVTAEDEHLLLKDYFLPPERKAGGRDLEDYDRIEHGHEYDVIVITAGMRAQFE